MQLTRYQLFFESHQHPAGWNEECDYLLYHFFRTYEAPGEFTNEIIPRLNALLEDKTDPELPDDWSYFWGKLLPRKNYVYFIDPLDIGKVPPKSENSWEGSALLNETLVEQLCNKFLKISTKELLKLCMEWENFHSTK